MFPGSNWKHYARLHHLSWVEDPSNRDLRFDRNYIRWRIMPLLRQRWPAASATIARSARLNAELQELADELAIEDLQQAQGRWPGTLSIHALSLLSSARRRSLLRHWVRRQSGVMPGSRHLQRIERECLESRRMHSRRCNGTIWKLGGFGIVSFYSSRDPMIRQELFPGCMTSPLSLPDGLGKLVLEPAEQGISATWWQTGRGSRFAFVRVANAVFLQDPRTIGY